HEQEDVWISEAFFNLSFKYPDWRFLIAPRHPNRLNRLKNFYAKNSINVQCFSSGFRPGHNRTVFLMDETGYLPALYRLADAVFVGGSLVPCGGHNIIEPAFFKKAVMIGEHYKNFEEIVVEFLRYNALIILKKNGLPTSLDNIFSNTRLREEYGDRAYKVIDQNSGGMDNVSNFINSEFL
ncbi:MAG: hypothetical protein PHQ54_01430, partial [Candidatus Omnitrophica bacterium]|nr:hypothetical protein [Candidatus Omnitrophota bacterium]